MEQEKTAYRCECGRLLGLYESGAECRGYVQQCHRCKKQVEIKIEPQEGRADETHN